MASQLYYVRPRTGDISFNEAAAARLRCLLDSSVQRRFPKGLKVQVAAADSGCLADLAQAFREAQLRVTRWGAGAGLVMSVVRL